ncbi:MAG: hydroxymethylbilane synthase [Chloroherpetonaceae bacterium]|nr:hydroxymethylbilane synthase [Chloroherpetonaceae bacterium]
MKSHLKIGTRSSPLALWQANFVKEKIEAKFSELNVELVHIKTTGDKILDSPLSKIGDKGLFTREIEHALIRKEIDLAVHSLKDLPTLTPPGLKIAAITERENTQDVLIAKKQILFSELPNRAKIATGSLRRKSQLLALRPDLEIHDIRGNLNTRFKKFDESDFDAMMLAYAGVFRLGFHERISYRFSESELLPAVGQGALGIETREQDSEIEEMINHLNHPPTEFATKAERALLRVLEGGCQIPIGAYAVCDRHLLKISAYVGSLDGRKSIRHSISGSSYSVLDAEALGMTLANELLKNGAREILDEIRQKPENNEK